MFPRCSYFCKNNRITVNKSEQKPTNILTNEAQESLKRAATSKHDYVMYEAIKDVELIAAEFKKQKVLQGIY